MRVPQQLKDVDQRGALVRTFEYDDSSVIVVDFGTEHANYDVDLVGNTAIVVDDDEHVEFDVPEEASDVEMNNGVLTITE
ncbi:hypothetical protein ACFQGT_11935 [Natrialbaceae archaeon GCM10025810]|uniref:DUF7127 family protein n=1 Tax=Halovalidus salilacus TaxID=3075124 RepID=UPI003609D618